KAAARESAPGHEGSERSDSKHVSGELSEKPIARPASEGRTATPTTRRGHSCGRFGLARTDRIAAAVVENPLADRAGRADARTRAGDEDRTIEKGRGTHATLWHHRSRYPRDSPSCGPSFQKEPAWLEVLRT